MNRNGLTWTPTASATPLPIPGWADGSSIGNKPVTANWQEVSGLCFANATAGHLWAVSDASANRMLAIRISDGAGRGEWPLQQALDAGADLEDCATRTINGVNYLYIADIGDNGAARTSVNIYRCVEPAITGSDGSILTVNVEKLNCTYPASPAGEGGGVGRDAECLLVDTNGDMYIITKRIASVQLFRRQHSVVGTAELEYLGTITSPPLTQNATGSNGGYVVGGDINAAGNLIVIHSYREGYAYQRAAGMTILQALNQTPTTIGALHQPTTYRATMPSPNTDMPQWEALCFDSSDNLYAASEYLTAYGMGASNHPTFKFNKLTKPVYEIGFQDGVLPNAGYAGTRDAYIHRNNGGVEDSTNFGTNAQLIVDYDSANVQRSAFLLWDLSAHIPVGATVVGAEMILNIEVEGNYFQAFRVLGITWAEGTVTYASIGHMPLFDNVEISSTAESLTTGWVGLTGVARYKLSTATVQAWVSTPASNKGLYLWGSVTDANGQRFTSREGVTATQRPKLLVRYTL